MSSEKATREKAFIVTARKYRPQTFGDLVSQAHVSETLRNAIQSGRLAHAYLFSGPRGVGKTTGARLLAKAINCTTSLSERDRGEACRQCESCRSFEEGRSLNIIEIDAASNNSVDDIRALRDKVIIPPQGARKKVYIIDEVHMLSNAAFNALLKTLEEPPPHALFIFATTEPHKVLPTILSRCQRFDFKRIPVADIVYRLKEICVIEGFTADEESLVLIAQKGDGALRDALSVFDQSIALCGTDLRYAELAKALGVIANDLYFAITDMIHQRETAPVFRFVQALVTSGADYLEFVGGLSDHLRNLLVAHSTQSGALIEAAEAVQQRYQEEAARFAEPDLLRMLQLVSEGEQALKTSAQPRLRLEMMLVKLVTMPASVDLHQLLRHLGRLESQIKSGHLPPVASSSGSSSGPSSAPIAGGSPPTSASKPTSYTNPRPALPEGPPTTVAEPALIAARPPAVERSQTTARTPVSYEALFGKPALAGVTPTRPTKVQDSEVPATALSQPTMRIQVAEKVAQEDYNRIFFEANKYWSDFLSRIKRGRIAVFGMLNQTRLDRAERATLMIAAPDAMHADLLTQQRDWLASELADVAGLSRPPSLTFYIQPTQQTETAQKAEAEANDPYQQLQRLSQTNATVRALIDHFGAEIVW
ncbi:MAG: DNA polymerase III subunit gamma/tau [Bacteroidetes Order II. Incertae sedis bacterium]|nr:DNA polymerase III subunit gamma/tau [Bacteroidetes Order II. bacterium]